MEHQTVTTVKTIFDYCSGKKNYQEVVDALMVFESLEQNHSEKSVVTKEHLQKLNGEALFSGLKHQPRYKSVLSDWNDYTRTTKELTQDQAIYFANRLFSCQEVDDNFITYNNIAGLERRYKGNFGDCNTIRPQPKAGWTIHITRKGVGRYNCVRSVIETEPQDILLFSPNAYLDCERAPEAECWHYNWLLFKDDSRIMDLMDWPEVGAGIYKLSIKDLETFSFITDAIDSLCRHSWSVKPRDIRIRSTYVENMLLHCNQVIEDNGFLRTDHRLISAIKYIEDHLFSELTTEKIAEAACLSVSSLTQLFKKRFGISIMQWREEKRMSTACNQLLHTNKKIVQIAEDLGYSNQMYFARCFKKHMKISPTDYRKQHLSE